MKNEEIELKYKLYSDDYSLPRQNYWNFIVGYDIEEFYNRINNDSNIPIIKQYYFSPSVWNDVLKQNNVKLDFEPSEIRIRIYTNKPNEGRICIKSGGDLVRNEYEYNVDYHKYSKFLNALDTKCVTKKNIYVKNLHNTKEISIDIYPEKLVLGEIEFYDMNQHNEFLSMVWNHSLTMGAKTNLKNFELATVLTNRERSLL